MEREFYASTVPAGLLDNNIEFMVDSGEIKFTNGGTIHYYDEMTVADLSMIRTMYDKDFKAQNGMELLGIYGPDERLKKYIFCRFGGCNHTPDIDHDNDEINAEYWNCGFRPCMGDGLICKYPVVKQGKLTSHEVRIIREIGDDRLNKQIAESLHISTETVNKECKRIAEKIGCKSQKGVATFGGRNMIF